jgi:hypothetical protein
MLIGTGMGGSTVIVPVTPFDASTCASTNACSRLPALPARNRTES